MQNYWLPLLLWNYHCKALALLLKAVLHQRAKRSVFFVPRPRALHWLFVFCLFSCCSSSGITSFLWYHSLLGEHWLSLVVVFKWELWLCSVFLTCWYLLCFFSSVFVVFLTLGVNSVSVISLTQPQTRTHSRQCSATDDRILKFIRSWLIGTLNCSTDELLYFEGH